MRGGHGPGSPESHERLTQAVAANGSDLLAYLERRVHSAEDAADLLGEVFLVAWRRVAVVPDDAHSTRLWLFGVARHVLANHHRGLRRRLELSTRLRGEVARVARLDAAVDGLNGADAGGADAVRDAVADLPADLRELVMLVHWDGFGIAEAGEIMGLGASTTRTRYQRARELLTAALMQRAGTHPVLAEH